MRNVLAFVTLLFGVIPAAPSLAQAPGSADPFGLASIGVVIPFFTSAGNKSFLEVASPVGDNARRNSLRLVFFTADCARSAITTLPLTTNGIEAIDLSRFVNFDGLLLIGSVGPAMTARIKNPIHVLVRWFDPTSNSWHTLAPITIASAEGSPNQTWNPLRTAATFIAPLQGSDSPSLLYLVCPSARVTREIFGAPALSPGAATDLRVRIYDDQERFLRDTFIRDCRCLTTLRLTDISPIYSDPTFSSTYYTELEGRVTPSAPGSFTGYLRVFRGQPDDFHRLHSGNWQSIQGAVTPNR